MKEKLQSIKEQALSKIAEAQDINLLNDIKVSILGKKGELTQVLKSMKDVAPEDRPKVGQMVNETRAAIEAVLEENKEKLHELAAFLLERETITGEEFMRLLNSEADVIETSATVVKEGEADAEEASSI